MGNSKPSKPPEMKAFFKDLDDFVEVFQKNIVVFLQKSPKNCENSAVDSVLQQLNKKLEMKLSAAEVLLQSARNDVAEFLASANTTRPVFRLAPETEDESACSDTDSEVASVSEGGSTRTLQGLTTELMDHQDWALTWMISREDAVPCGGILADEPGMGKTLSFISLILAQKNARNGSDEFETRKTKALEKAFENEGGLIPVFSTLVVASKPVIRRWKNEIEKHVEPGKLKILVLAKNENNPKVVASCDVVFATCQTVVSQLKTNDSVLARIGWERIILDDADQLRNERTETFEGCCRLPAMARWASTGTPIHEGLRVLLNLFGFLRVHVSGKVWEEFIESNETKLSEKMKKTIKSLLLRRTKQQICPPTKKSIIQADLKTVKVAVKLEGFEKLCYQILSQKLRLSNLKLQQACCHMFLIKNVIDLEAFQNLVLAEWKRSLEQVPTSGITFFQIDDQKDSIGNVFLPTFLSSKVKVLLDDLDKVVKLGDKSVVVSQWNAMLDIIQWHLERSKVVSTTITGKVASKQRQKRADDFNRGEAQVLLLSSGVGASGIDLTGANHLFFVDLHWDPASEQEIIGRIHCIGQKKDVIVHKLVAEDTVDEQILDEQAEKTAAVEEILHEFSSDQCCCPSDESSVISEE